MPFTVYILHSLLLNKFYIGFTGDLLEERIRRHLSNHAGFTGTVKDWQLVHTELYETKQAASKREREIKSWKSSRRIKELIAQNGASRL